MCSVLYHLSVGIRFGKKKKTSLVQSAEESRGKGRGKTPHKPCGAPGVVRRPASGSMIDAMHAPGNHTTPCPHHHYRHSTPASSISCLLHLIPTPKIHHPIGNTCSIPSPSAHLRAGRQLLHANPTWRAVQSSSSLHLGGKQARYPMFSRTASPNFYFATSNSTVNPPWRSANRPITFLLQLQKGNGFAGRTSIGHGSLLQKVRLPPRSRRTVGSPPLQRRSGRRGSRLLRRSWPARSRLVSFRFVLVVQSILVPSIIYLSPAYVYTISL